MSEWGVVGSCILGGVDGIGRSGGGECIRGYIELTFGDVQGCGLGVSGMWAGCVVLICAVCIVLGRVGWFCFGVVLDLGVCVLSWGECGSRRFVLCVFFGGASLVGADIWPYGGAGGGTPAYLKVSL